MAALPCAAPALAADTDGLDLSGNVRARYECLAGQPRAGFDDRDEMLSFRTNLQAIYRTDGWELGATLHDSRAYLDDRGSPVTTNEVNALEVTQLYVTAPLGKGATLQAGRMLANLGSRRFVTNDEYRNTPNGFTGLRLDAGNTRLHTTLFAWLPQRRLPEDLNGLLDNRVVVDRESFDTALVGGMLAAPRLFHGVSADFAYYGLFERDGAHRATRDRRLHTLTGRLFRDPAPGRADFEIEYARQLGSISATALPGAARRDVSAWFLHAEVGRQWAGGWTPRLSAELEWASGDRGGGSFNRFDTLYGARRADLGPTGIAGAITRANIIAPVLRLDVTPSKRLDAFIAYRPMWLDSRTDAFSASGVRDAAGASGRFAGYQIEARARRWLIAERLRAEADVAWLAKGRFLRNAPNATNIADTRYVALAVSAFF
jgi:hypothetical protein